MPDIGGDTLFAETRFLGKLLQRNLVLATCSSMFPTEDLSDSPQDHFQFRTSERLGTKGLKQFIRYGRIALFFLGQGFNPCETVLQAACRLPNRLLRESPVEALGDQQDVSQLPTVAQVNRVDGGTRFRAFRRQPLVALLFFALPNARLHQMARREYSRQGELVAETCQPQSIADK